METSTGCARGGREQYAIILSFFLNVYGFKSRIVQNPLKHEKCLKDGSCSLPPIPLKGLLECHLGTVKFFLYCYRGLVQTVFQNRQFGGYIKRQ